jgi:hypothetical protein
VLLADARAITDRIRPDVLLHLLTKNGSEIINWLPGPNAFAFPTPNYTPQFRKLRLDYDKGRARVVNTINERLPSR